MALSRLLPYPISHLFKTYIMYESQPNAQVQNPSPPPRPARGGGNHVFRRLSRIRSYSMLCQY